MRYLVSKDGKFLTFAHDLSMHYVADQRLAWHYTIKEIAQDIARSEGAVVVEVEL